MGLWNGEEPATSGGAEPEHGAEGPVRSVGGPTRSTEAARGAGSAPAADPRRAIEHRGVGGTVDTPAPDDQAPQPQAPTQPQPQPLDGSPAPTAAPPAPSTPAPYPAPLPGSAYYPVSHPQPAPRSQQEQPSGWQPPSAVEQDLYEAKERGDWAGYFDVLARTPLFVADSRARVDAHPDSVVFTPYRDPRTRTDCLAVYTEGMLPAPVEDPVFHSGSLGWYARVWGAKDPQWLAVNPGSPCEAYFPTTTSHRAVWQQHAERAARCSQPPRRLRALYIGGPLRGPVAHGLACGALLSVSNGELWNAMAYHGGGYTAERDRLAEWWGIGSRADWQRTQDLLLRAEMTSPVWEFTLGIRRSLALDFAGAVEVDHWRQVAERALWHGAAEAAEPRITPDGVTVAQPRSDAEVRSQVAGVRRLIGRIMRYEARFRADGLLGEGKFVRSVEAWDYGRASCMARWGLGARYCTLEEAEQGVLRAGRLSQANYRSWQDFSAAYILGRCLHFDEEEFGDWYEDMAAAHQLLMSDPGSPWRNIPWK
ncbi:DUF1266 domain-containing protein [Streptomyces sp. 796.1]|uniref:DUF1266 domain-containing protein n=1 Tax=Streptomyces sp. 796.1 TaxID=3163029 RepID=UPI0039C8C2A9